jgi:signal transduction histidine kinase
MASSLAKNEEDRAAVREELESRVASRTAELALANKRLSLLDQQRIRFLADASHELRTPLTALRGEAEVALRKVDAPAGSYRAALDRIVQWSGEMTQLVDDLMFLARSDSDEVRLHLGKFRCRTSCSTWFSRSPISTRASELRYERTTIPKLSFTQIAVASLRSC